MRRLVQKRRCTARRADGKPCRAWAMQQQAGDRGPRCAAHRHVAVLDPIVVEMPREGGFYDHAYTDAEYAALHAAGAEDGLQGEVALIRVLLRRMLEEVHAGRGMGGHDLEARVLVMFKGVEVLGTTMLRNRALQDAVEDKGRQAIAMALEELSEELGL